MDKRLRDSEKRYRTREDTTYKTKSLTLEKDLLLFIEKEVEKTDDKNMSKFIEENVINSEFLDVPKRRKFKTFPVKKTFTFTDKFSSILEKSNNGSLFIETVLKEKFNLK